MPCGRPPPRTRRPLPQPPADRPGAPLASLRPRARLATAPARPRPRRALWPRAAERRRPAVPRAPRRARRPRDQAPPSRAHRARADPLDGRPPRPGAIARATTRSPARVSRGRPPRRPARPRRRPARARPAARAARAALRVPGPPLRVARVGPLRLLAGTRACDGDVEREASPSVPKAPSGRSFYRAGEGACMYGPSRRRRSNEAERAGSERETRAPKRTKAPRHVAPRRLRESWSARRASNPRPSAWEFETRLRNHEGLRWRGRRARQAAAMCGNADGPARLDGP